MIDYPAIAQRLERGETCAAIAREMGILRLALRWNLRKLGLTHSGIKPRRDDGLSHQQGEIAQLLKDGRSYQQIADWLGTSDGCVRTQICRIRRVQRAHAA